MPVGGFIQELKSLKEEVRKINEVSSTLCHSVATGLWKVGKSNMVPLFAKLSLSLRAKNKWGVHVKSTLLAATVS